MRVRARVIARIERAQRRDPARHKKNFRRTTRTADREPESTASRQQSPSRWRPHREPTGTLAPVAAVSRATHATLQTRLRHAGSLRWPRSSRPASDEIAALRVDLDPDLIADLQRIRRGLLGFESPAVRKHDLKLRRAAEVDYRTEAAMHANAFSARRSQSYG